MSYDYRPRANDPPSTPDAGSPGGDTSGAGGGVTILLTGTETEPGNFFRGDEDPALTPAYLAILAAGDIWVDTTFGPPYAHKERNAANDGWTVPAIYAYDDAGNLVGSVQVDGASGNIRLIINAEDSEIPRGMVEMTTEGDLTLSANDVTGSPIASIALNDNNDGSIRLSTLDGVDERAIVLSVAGGVVVPAGDVTLTSGSVIASGVTVDGITLGGTPFGRSAFVDPTTADAEAIADAMIAVGLMAPS